MTLEDFEKSLAESQEKKHERSDRDRHHRDRRERHSDRKDESRRHRHAQSSHHRRHSSRSRDRGSERDHESRRHDRRDHHDRRDDNGHRHKRSRHSAEQGDDEHARKRSKDVEEASAPNEAVQEKVIQEETAPLKRDSWMEAPSALDIDYVQRRRPSRSEEDSKPKMLSADFELKIHEKELNSHLRDLRDGKDLEDISEEPTQREVDYKFGDSGSQWRLTKLKGVYREAETSGRPVEDIAVERFGDLQSFDDAREEEIEMDRRDTYGKSYEGKEKPSGELFQERNSKNSAHSSPIEPKTEAQGQKMNVQPPLNTTQHLDQTALNRLKAQMMKAKLKKSSDADGLEEQYNLAVAAMANRKDPGVVVLGVQHNRLLAGAKNEVKAVDTKRGRDRGQVEDNEDMTIEDMVREERKTRGQYGGEGKRLAERIGRDEKFKDDLEYMDDNAAKLAKRVHRSDIDIKNATIHDFQKMNKILDNCPLCHHEDTNTPPVAPVVSLATRVFLTLPTEPELSEGGATIVPIQHRTNLMECDDDEWEEIRNFMKSLTRMYHDQGRDVIFYENAARPQQKRHAAMEVVPLPYSLGETSPAFFKEAILSAEGEWSQHRKLIDTLAGAKKGLGRSAFRRTMSKEMPYFHVWFELDGGLGHIVEDDQRWPRGDLFAREIIGGMLDSAPDVIKRQGRWQRGSDRRVDGFRKRWRKFDWTRILIEG